MQIFHDTRIDFLGNRQKAIRISLVAVAISILSLILHGGPKLGIDFHGGTLMQLRFESNIQVEEIRTSLGNIGMGSAEIKTFADPREVLIHVEQSETGASTPDRIREILGRDIPNNPFEIRRLETVGPRIGGELVTSAIWAIVAAILLMVIYISARFEFRFALGALAALVHDVLITLGIFSILNVEVSLAVVAALLTIVGYSLNDTIVVFDRVRENLKLLRRETLIPVLNKSINSTLSRTVITSSTTLLVVIMLYLFGGEVISSFAFALLIGVMVGTYSSIFIASPVLVWWDERQTAKKSVAGSK